MSTETRTPTQTTPTLREALSSRTTVLAWHFLAESRRLRTGERVRKGSRFSMEETPKLCGRSYHGSERLIDALRYAPSPIVCRVEIGGKIVGDIDKLVGQTRKVLAIADATRTLDEFSLWCATNALRAERRSRREPDPGSWEALRVKRLWLSGKATDDELRAAWSAAWSAAWNRQNRKLTIMVEELLGV